MRIRPETLGLATGLLAFALAGSAQQAEPAKAGCRQEQRTVTPVTDQYPTRLEAELEATRKAEKACGPPPGQAMLSASKQRKGEACLN